MNPSPSRKTEKGIISSKRGYLLFLTGVDVELIQRCGRRHIINAKKETQRKSPGSVCSTKKPERKRMNRREENMKNNEADDARKNETYKNKILTVPNVLSAFRLLLVPALAWLYLVRKDYSATAWVLLLSGATDIADGFIARRFGMVSDLGKALDPIADKLTQIVMLACLLTRFGNLLFPCVLLIVKEIVTGCMGIAVIRRTGKVLAAEWHGKLTTFLLYTLMIAHVVFYNIAPALSDTLIIICTAMMCFSFLLYMMRNIRALKSVGKKTEKKPERTVQAFER